MVTRTNAWIKKRTKERHELKDWLHKNHSTYTIMSKIDEAGYRVECARCGVEKHQFIGYFQQYPRCRCVSQLGSTSFTQAQFEKRYNLKSRRLKLLSPYVKMSDRIRVRCLDCGLEWTSFTSNLRTAGCPNCAAERIKRENLEKYGVEFSSQRPDVQKKIRRTMRKRYGVEHALQNKKLFDKNLVTSFKLKAYWLGRKRVSVQGYEPFALDYLITVKGIKPEQIVCGRGSKVPSVLFEWNGRTKVYHPDIWIPHQNKLIEVKSEFTYKYAYEENQAKRRACKKQGYKFAFLIMDREGNRV